MKIAFDLPEIEGFEYTGAYRTAEAGEYILIHDHVIECQGHSYEYPILKRKAPKYRTEVISYKEGKIKMVDIKALKDLVRLAQTNIEDMSNAQTNEWEEIKEILNDNYQDKRN